MVNNLKFALKDCKNIRKFIVFILLMFFFNFATLKKPKYFKPKLYEI